MPPSINFTALPLSQHRPLLRAALIFRNTFTEYPHFCEGLLTDEDRASGHCFTWTTSAEIRVLKWTVGLGAAHLSPDGTVTVTSDDGWGTLNLAPHGQLFTIRWPMRLQRATIALQTKLAVPCQLVEPPAADHDTYLFIEQRFSLQSYPKRWHGPLALAVGLWRSQHPEEEASWLPEITCHPGPWCLTELPAARPSPSSMDHVAWPTLPAGALCVLLAGAHINLREYPAPHSPGGPQLIVELTPAATYHCAGTCSAGLMEVVVHADESYLQLRYSDVAPSPFVLHFSAKLGSGPICAVYLAAQAPHRLWSKSGSLSLSDIVEHAIALHTQCRAHASPSCPLPYI
uniref:Uncharacterized protein n=1 Tax=Eutreptiella gymnastica TaxID=73025 RepID=A0A7S1I0Y4_9EUGL